MSQSSVAPADRRALNRRRIYAVLAGGLVLGVGAAVTLAAWNDSEFAKSTFTAGTFDLQGSPDGTNFSSHATSDAASPLTFSLDVDNVIPGQSLYALYSVRLIGSTDGSLTVKAPTIAGDNAANLTAGTALISGITCDASTYAAGSQTMPTAITASEDGSTGQLNFCLKVTAGDDLLQAKAGDVTWEWDAVSQ